MRPNVLPAKVQGQITRGEYAEQHVQMYRKGTTRLRRTTHDLCDFCTHVVVVKRYYLHLRKNGIRFMCDECRKDPSNKEHAENPNNYHVQRYNKEII